MATVCPAPAAVFSLYAEARSAGLRPVGPAVAAGLAFASTLTQAWQRAPSGAAGRTGACCTPAPSAEELSSSIGELPPQAAAKAATTIATRSFDMSTPHQGATLRRAFGASRLALAWNPPCDRGMMCRDVGWRAFAFTLQRARHVERAAASATVRRGS